MVGAGQAVDSASPDLRTPGSSVSRPTLWAILRAQVVGVVLWGVALVIIGRLSAYLNLKGPLKDELRFGVGQAVPAIVTAVFVFGVGTAFVVAQIVPSARGTRAVRILRGKRLGWTITPALTLIAGSAWLLAGLPGSATLVYGLLVGAVLYVVIATTALLSLFDDATDPTNFKDLVISKAKRATRSLKFGATIPRELARIPATQRPSAASAYVLREVRRRAMCLTSLEGAVDDLYAMVRICRGWMRVSASTGDSREVQECLEATAYLVEAYNKYGIVSGPFALPTEIILDRFSDTRAPDTQGLRCGSHTSADECAAFRATWSWLGRPEPTQTWFADEVGRAMVRAVEYGIQSQTLLDRDLLRFLIAISNAAERFAERTRATLQNAPRDNAALMIRCLVELGLGARRCPPERLDWYFLPALRLGHLQKHFARQGSSNAQDLALVAGAGLLLVVEAIASNEAGGVSSTDSRPLERSTLRGLRSMFHSEGALLSMSSRASGISDARMALVCLTTSRLLEPDEHPYVHNDDAKRLERLLVALTDEEAEQMCLW